MKLKKKLSYAVGDFGYSLVYIFLNAFILAFLTEGVHIPSGKAGLLVLLANICDAISDPVIGFIADKRKTKGKEYKNWVKLFTVPAAISFILCFFAPDIDKGPAVLYSYVFYLIWTLLKTCVHVPYSALSAALTEDSTDRISVGAIRDWMSNVGGVIISTAAVGLVGYFGSGQVAGYRYAALIIGAISIICYLSSAFFTKEAYYVAKEADKNQREFSVIQAVRALLTMRSALALIGFVLMGQMAMGIRTSLMTYYCMYYLGDTSLSVMSANMTLSYIIPILGIPFVPKLAGKIGRRPVMCIGAVLAMSAGAMSLAARQNFLAADISGALVGCGICFQMSIVWGVMPDTADDVFYHKGIAAAGMLTAFITLCMATGTGLCGFIASTILNVSGYDSVLAVQTVQTGTVLYASYGILPLIFGFLMLLCALLFRLHQQN